MAAFQSPHSSLVKAALLAFALVSCVPTRVAKAQSAPPSTNPTTSSAQLDGRPCLSVDEAAKSANRDVCVSAHVFDIVEIPDGTRFLDVCSSETPDDKCRFTFVSMPSDRTEVGDLTRYRDQNVRVRGIVRSTHGRMGIVISHMRQFRGGPEKFRPNPRLVRGFDGQSDQTPVRDPNLATTGRHRSFMNSRDTESLPSRTSR